MPDHVPGIPPDTDSSEQRSDAAPGAAPDATHVEQPENALPPLSLADLPQALQDAVARAGWPSLMPVQSHALPYLLQGRDLMVQARTGSGKTGAFLLPALERLDASKSECQCLILVPTRELALQVEHVALALFKGTGLTAAAVYGGVGYGRQMEALRNGVQLLVGVFFCKFKNS